MDLFQNTANKWHISAFLSVLNKLIEYGNSFIFILDSGYVFQSHNKRCFTCPKSNLRETTTTMFNISNGFINLQREHL